MFFKQRLSVMIGVFRQHLQGSIDKWQAEITARGETRIDITVEFERIFAHTINHICFGEDFNDDKFDFHLYNKATDSFTWQKVSMRQAISNMTTLMIGAYVRQLENPITGPLNILFGVRLELGSYFKKMRENAAAIRSQVMKYIRLRKSGTHKSKM